MDDRQLIKKAIVFAAKKHNGQLYGDKPYFVHPRLTALLLKLVLPEDRNLVAAGYLHDTLEDTDTTYQELVREFNRDVANLVREVTKKQVQGTKLFPHLHTKRGIILKFADRLSNLSAMDTWPRARQQKYLLSSKFWKRSIGE